jgi:exodeoxyribonuclease VII large subunit
VRTVAQLVADWIGRLGAIWVEGQVAQLNRRPGAGRVFLTLRDPAADISLQVTCAPRVLESADPTIGEGDRIVVWAKPQFYAARGSFSLSAREIRHVGLGELLARIERLKQLLAKEGLFAAERKKPLPFIPRRIGLICGRASAAERDVVENASKRWPGVSFEIKPVAVQGATAAPQVTAALRELDADPNVDVIVVTRGGGSAEDLLPFSEETLIRAVAAAATPVVSAIGHEQDAPLLDLVADIRASTPTDAARRLVPDLQEQLHGLTVARGRLREAAVGRIDREHHLLMQIRGRPVLAAPHVLVDAHEAQLGEYLDRNRRAMRSRLDRAQDGLDHTRARVKSLSPGATLDRGYAVVQTGDGAIVREPAAAGTRLHVRVAAGSFDAVASADS